MIQCVRSFYRCCGCFKPIQIPLAQESRLKAIGTQKV